MLVLILQVLMCSAYTYFTLLTTGRNSTIVVNRKEEKNYQEASLVVTPNALKQQLLYPWIMLLLL